MLEIDAKTHRAGNSREVDGAVVWRGILIGCSRNDRWLGGKNRAESPQQPIIRTFAKRFIGRGWR